MTLGSQNRLVNGSLCALCPRPDGRRPPRLPNSPSTATSKLFLFMVPGFIGHPMDLNIPKVGFWHAPQFISRREATYTAETGLPFPLRIQFVDTWKEMANPFELRRVFSVANPPTSGRYPPLQCWARYI